MQRTKLFLALSLTVALSACGGGSSSGGSNDSNVNISTVSEQPSPDGIYRGTGRDASGELEFIALVHDYQIHAVSTGNIQYEGEIISYPGSSEYGLSLLMYGSDLSVFDQAVVDGTYTPEDTIRGEWRQSLGGTGNFTLSYEAVIYEQPASIADITGTWGDTNLSTPPTITIDRDGDFYGSDSAGCSYTGNFSVPRADRNMFKVQLLVENCSFLNGTYAGLAAVLGAEGSETIFAFAANNSESWPFMFERR